MRLGHASSALLALAIGAAACGTSSSGGNEDTCSIGTEACPCTQGGACDPDLECYSGLCVRVGGVGGTGGAGTGGTAGTGGDVDVCKASTDAAFAACPIDEQYYQPTLEDCEDRRSGQPAACLAAYDTALGCESSPSAWTCNTDGENGPVTASPTGCDAEIAAHKACLAGAGGAGGTGGTGGSTGGSGGGACVDPRPINQNSTVTCADCNPGHVCVAYDPYFDWDWACLHPCNDDAECRTCGASGYTCQVVRTDIYLSPPTRACLYGT